MYTVKEGTEKKKITLLQGSKKEALLWDLNAGENEKKFNPMPKLNISNLHY